MLEVADNSPGAFARLGLNRRTLGQQNLEPTRLTGAKRAFTTRRVELSLARRLATDCAPRAGDLLLARIESIGLHGRLESPHGRRCRLYPGDEIVVAYGARYAPDQFEAVVPENLDSCHLAAGGGIAARVVHRHESVAKPTRIAPIGLLAGEDKRILNLRQFALPDPRHPANRPTAIVVAGTSMNAGKTTTAAALVHGLALAGLRVGAAKVTGTGSGGDVWTLTDAGARRVVDFTDAGHATTAGLDLLEIERIALTLLDHLANEPSDIIVIEVADGVLQRETAHLLSAKRFQARIGGILFAAGDSMGAGAGVNWLRQRNLPLIGISGLVSASPLGAREARQATGLDVLDNATLSDPLVAPNLCLAATDAEPVYRTSS
ncbi:MAG: DUF1611 domain-containing protein [Allosphingosinicella sp.]|uniref:DUF1611 domain-containing protein n=1 Tax=Allosphingosinicella sp. TaxID=2823234 RepID=UPI0039446079